MVIKENGFKPSSQDGISNKTMVKEEKTTMDRGQEEEVDINEQRR